MEAIDPNEFLGSPSWWRLAAAAKAAGFSPQLFLSAVERGEIPVRVEQFGARGLWFVHAETYRDWLAGRLPVSAKAPT
jgi:hypothetical protein